MHLLNVNDERRLRELAHGIAKGIEPPHDVMSRLGFSQEDYNLLSESTTFKDMLSQAVNEWQGASNTQKRIKLKAAVNIEEGLPSMFHAMTDSNEPLAARVKVFETMARIAGVGVTEPAAAGSGHAFMLQINMGGKQVTVTNVSAAIPEEPVIIEHEITRVNINDELSAGMEDV